METITSGSLWGLKNASLLCVAMGAFSALPQLHADELNEVKKQETARRVDRSMEAKKLLAVGDEAYAAGQYKGAVDAYQQARAILPKSRVTEEYSEALNDRYAKAVVEYSKILIREGKVPESQELLSKLTETKTFENDPLLQKASDQAYDPIRTNPSVTAEHGVNVDNVKRLLYQAIGAEESGQFDKSIKFYEDVLRIDSTNRAARRGMTRVRGHQASYGRAAYDEARARMLTDVEEAWEIKPISEFFLGSTIVSDGDQGAAPVVAGTREKISSITIPRFDLEDGTIGNALEQLKLLIRDNDPEPDVNKKGINMVLNLGGELNELGKEIAEKKFNLSVTNIPADELLNLICKQTNTEWKADQYTVSVLPRGQLVSELFLRQFTVPPNFLSQLLEKRADEGVLFQDIGSSKTARKNTSTQDYLEALGVQFPKGATAKYLPASNLLTVVNTPGNMRTLAKAIQSVKDNQSVIIDLKLKVVDITEEDLNELSYDWLLSPQKIAGQSTFLGGGSAGNGSDVIPIQPGVGSVTGSPLTSGLRSGGNAFPVDSIQARINQVTNLGQLNQTANVSPSVLALTAFANNANVQVLLRGLSQGKGTSDIWAPSVTLRPGERARIENVRLFTYPTEYDPPEVPDNIGNVGGNAGVSVIPITPATPTAFEQKSIGRILDVSATVDSKRRYISVDIEPVFSEFIGFINYGSPIFGFMNGNVNAQVVPVVANDILMPIFETVTTKTSVTIADGTSIAIGGLTRIEVQQVNDKVPVLGSLPFVGNFFESNGTRTIKRVLVIFVEAQLVDPLGNLWRDKNLEAQQ